MSKMEESDSLPENLKKALTSIHDPYTLAYTPEVTNSEEDQIIIDHFVETLAEVAFNIASRKKHEKQA